MKMKEKYINNQYNALCLEFVEVSPLPPSLVRPCPWPCLGPYRAHFPLSLSRVDQAQAGGAGEEERGGQRGRQPEDQRAGGDQREAGGPQGILRVQGLGPQRHLAAGQDQGGAAAAEGGDPLLRPAHRRGLAQSAGRAHLRPQPIARQGREEGQAAPAPRTQRSAAQGRRRRQLAALRRGRVSASPSPRPGGTGRGRSIFPLPVLDALAPPCPARPEFTALTPLPHPLTITPPISSVPSSHYPPHPYRLEQEEVPSVTQTNEQAKSKETNYELIKGPARPAIESERRLSQEQGPAAGPRRHREAQQGSSEPGEPPGMSREREESCSRDTHTLRRGKRRRGREARRSREFVVVPPRE